MEAPEIIPLHAPALLGTDEVRFIAQQSLALVPDDRARLKVPLERLALAIARRTEIDKAIDLGIAIESLLTTQSDGTSEVGYKVRQRAALLGGASNNQRVQIASEVKDIYTLRSQAVHTGKLIKPRKATATLDKGAQLCASLIRKVIERGAIPNWESWIWDSTMPS